MSPRIPRATPPRRTPWSPSEPSGARRGRGKKARARAISAPAETSLLDVVDNLLSQGVVLQGDAVLGVADVDLIYLRLSVLLCAMDRVGPVGR